MLHRFRSALSRSACILLGTLAACSEPSAPEPPALTDVTVALVSPPASISPGVTLRAEATPLGLQAGASVTYAWTSSNALVATVSGTGSSATITAVSPGSTTVSVLASGSGPGLTTASIAPKSVTITVVAPPVALQGALTVSPGNLELTRGGSLTLTPSVTRGGANVDVQYAYRSNNSAVVSITAAGVVTGVAAGTGSVTVTATGSGAGFTTTTLSAEISARVLAPALDSVRNAPSALSLVRTSTRQLSPSTFGPGVGTVPVQLGYTSSAPDVATVSTTGLVTAAAPGTAQITITATATAAGNFSARTVTIALPVEVRDGILSVTLAPRTPEVLLGGSTTVTADVQATGALPRTVTFQSRATDVATVSANGLVQGIAPGTARIIAISTADPSVRDSVTVRVSGIRLLAVSGGDQVTFTRTPFTSPFLVRAVDAQDGRPLPGTSVQFAISDPAGVLSARTVITDASGNAQVRWTPGPRFDDALVASAPGNLAPITISPRIRCSATRRSPLSSPITGRLDESSDCQSSNFLFGDDLFVSGTTSQAVRISASVSAGELYYQASGYTSSNGQDFFFDREVWYCTLAGGENCSQTFFNLAPSEAIGFYLFKPRSTPAAVYAINVQSVPLDFAGCPAIATNVLFNSGSISQQLGNTDCLLTGRPGDEASLGVARNKQVTFTVRNATFAQRITMYRYENDSYRQVSTVATPLGASASLVYVNTTDFIDHIVRVESQGPNGGSYQLTVVMPAPSALTSPFLRQKLSTQSNAPSGRARKGAGPAGSRLPPYR